MLRRKPLQGTAYLDRNPIGAEGVVVPSACLGPRLPILELFGAQIASGNELRRKYRHWAAYKRLLQEWEWRLAGALPKSRRWQHRDRVFRVTITSYRRRLLDPDNLVHGCKPVLDAIKRLGLIRDDSPRWLDLEVKQELLAAGDLPHTEIRFHVSARAARSRRSRATYVLQDFRWAAREGKDGWQR